MSFFERFIKITGKDLPDPDSLLPDEKCALTHQLKMAGESMMAIANYFGVSRQSAYNWLNKAKDHRLIELENKSYLDIFVEKIYELETTRDKYRQMIETIRSGTDILEVDGKNGKTSHLRNIAELGKLIRDYDKIILDTYYAVGLIPKADPQGIYGKMSDRNKLMEEEKDLVDHTDEELSSLLLETLTKKKRVLGGNALKSVKDEKVL